MEQNVQEALESIGLSDKEIKVYLALLELGESSVDKIAKHSEINRVTVYPLIKKLSEKGFVSKLYKEGKNYFKSIDPKQILDMLKEKADKIKLILPTLEQSKATIQTTTSIELFKGKRGMYSLIEKLFSGEETQFYGYGNFAVAEKVLEYPAMHGRKLRIQKKIKMNVAVSPLFQEYTKDSKYKKLTNMRFNNQLKDMNVYIVFGQRIIGIFEVTKELIGIVIENEEIANYHKIIFDRFWKEGKTQLKMS